MLAKRQSGFHLSLRYNPRLRQFTTKNRRVQQSCIDGRIKNESQWAEVDGLPERERQF